MCLKSFDALISCTDSDHIVDIIYEDLAITDMPCVEFLFDDINDLIYFLHFHYDIDLLFRKQSHHFIALNLVFRSSHLNSTSKHLHDSCTSYTNLAILVSHNFTEPFNQPIAYAQKVGELTNMLGAGHIMVQRYGDILDGKRTWQKELAQSNVKPTLKDAVAGDITAAMPYRAMTNIIEFIKMLDMVVPGFAANETLLYSPELKFYSNKVKMDENLDTNIKGLHCLGDSSGWTRGLMMASVMGVLMGRKLAEKEGC